MSIDKRSVLIGISILLCSLWVGSTAAIACPLSFSIDGGDNGSVWSFSATSGGSQTRTVTVDYPDPVTISVTGSDAFTLGPLIDQRNGKSTFTITFHPGSNAGGQFKAVLSVNCSACKMGANLEGTIPSADVATPVPNGVSISIGPNPVVDQLNIQIHGTRTVESKLYDLLGHEVASNQGEEWRLNAVDLHSGAYIIRVTGESVNGEPFLTSKRVISSR